MSTNDKTKFSFSIGKTKQATKAEEAYDASKPFAPRIPVVDLTPEALRQKYGKLALIVKIEKILLAIVVAFIGLWVLNITITGLQTSASNVIKAEIDGLQGEVASVEPYQKYLEGIELVRSNMGKVFAKNIDMGKVMDYVVANANANNIILNSIKITEATSTTEQNTCINSTPFSKVDQVGCITLSGTGQSSADVIAFFDGMGQSEGLTNSFITSMGTSGTVLVFSGSVSMNEDIYMKRFTWLGEDIDNILKNGGLTKGANNTYSQPTEAKSTPQPSQTPKPTATPETTATAKPSSANDTRFATCKEAIAAGFGPYTQGTDPEYEWYKAEDTQNTGKVCVS